MSRTPILATLALFIAACGDNAPPPSVSAPIPDPAGGNGAGVLSMHRYSDASCPARDYYVYTPANLPAGPRPLVVYLHGCTQSAQQAIDGVRWNELADREGILVAYPEQAMFTNSGAEIDGNGSRCWNWFLPQGQTRDSGEACAIAGITREVMTANAIDPKRVYVAGISAGGLMTSNLGATYPDLYAALGVVAGGAYTGADVTGALAQQAMGERAQRMPVLVFHGVTDTLDIFPLGLIAVRQWLGTNDLVDDGMANQSVPQTPATTESFAADENPSGEPRGGDTCVRNMNFPCPGGALGYQYHYPYSVEHYLDGDGEPLLDFWQILGLAHNYAGGDPRGTFVDPLGPDTTDVVWEFFRQHPKPSATP